MCAIAATWHRTATVPWRFRSDVWSPIEAALRPSLHVAAYRVHFAFGMGWRWKKFAFAAFLGLQASAAQTSGGESHGAEQRSALSIDIAALENPSQPDTVLGSKGAPVLRAQILLVQRSFFLR